MMKAILLLLGTVASLATTAWCDDLNSVRAQYISAAPSTDVTILAPFARTLNCLSYSTETSIAPESFTLQVTKINDDPLFDLVSTPEDFLQGLVDSTLVAAALAEIASPSPGIFLSNEDDFSQVIRISNQNGKSQLIMEEGRDPVMMGYEDQMFSKVRTHLPAISRADLSVSRYFICE